MESEVDGGFLLLSVSPLLGCFGSPFSAFIDRVSFSEDNAEVESFVDQSGLQVLEDGVYLIDFKCLGGVEQLIDEVCDGENLFVVVRRTAICSVCHKLLSYYFE